MGLSIHLRLLEAIIFIINKSHNNYYSNRQSRSPSKNYNYDYRSSSKNIRGKSRSPPEERYNNQGKARSPSQNGYNPKKEKKLKKVKKQKSYKMKVLYCIVL